MLAEFRAVAQELTYGRPSLPMVSTVTGETVTAEELTDPEYWVRHVRRPVRFADAVRVLAGQGVTRFLEAGPDGTLTALAQGALDEPAEGTGATLSVPSLRKDKPEAVALLTAVAGLFAHGADVDWPAVVPRTGRVRPVDLPTYAFQRKTYWPTPAEGRHVRDVSGLGLSVTGHPLLGAALAPADSDGVVFTGVLSPRRHPWLRDHVVGGTVLFPGTGFLELVLRGADQVGCDRIDDLTIAVPLVLPDRGGVRIQVVVHGPDPSGSRAVSVFSRPDDTEDAPWTLHATGSVSSTFHTTADQRPTLAYDFAVWPPQDAVPEPMETAYERLTALGLAYGPVFQGLRAMWRRGEEIFAEVALPDAHDDLADRFGIHPALLDSALHAVLLALPGSDDTLRLPFSWTGVSLWASGARHLRVRFTGRGADTVALELADTTGGPVASVETLVLREAGPLAPQNAAARADALYQVDWIKAPTPLATPAEGPLPSVGHTLPDPGSDLADGDVFVRIEPPDADGAVGAVHAVTVRALELVRGWLAEERFEGSRLVVVTEGAVGVDGPPAVPALAAVWGLVRAARAENPGRFALLDTDGSAESWAVARTALASGEPEIAVRGGTVSVPRLTRASSRTELPLPAQESAWRLDIAEKGTLEGLALVPVEQGELGAGQVRVAVRAAGVNFRDVLNALGMYPGDARDFGLEGAGVVTEVGAGVTGLAVGDRVFGMFSGAFGPVAVADARTVARVPEGWTFAQAASVPIVFLTA
ncbi:polyketide synthase family protein, partial [Streptomyces heilongjiangensis]